MSGHRSLRELPHQALMMAVLREVICWVLGQVHCVPHRNLGKAAAHTIRMFRARPVGMTFILAAALRVASARALCCWTRLARLELRTWPTRTVSVATLIFVP